MGIGSGDFLGLALLSLTTVGRCVMSSQSQRVCREGHGEVLSGFLIWIRN